MKNLPVDETLRLAEEGLQIAEAEIVRLRARVSELIDKCDELAIANDRLRNYYPVRQLNTQRAQLGLPEWP